MENSMRSLTLFTFLHNLDASRTKILNIFAGFDGTSENEFSYGKTNWGVSIDAQLLR
jgi:hypothetical protein